MSSLYLLKNDVKQIIPESYSFFHFVAINACELHQPSAEIEFHSRAQDYKLIKQTQHKKAKSSKLFRKDCIFFHLVTTQIRMNLFFN